MIDGNGFFDVGISGGVFNRVAVFQSESLDIETR